MQVTLNFCDLCDNWEISLGLCIISLLQMYLSFQQYLPSIGSGNNPELRKLSKKLVLLSHFLYTYNKTG